MIVEAVDNEAWHSSWQKVTASYAQAKSKLWDRIFCLDADAIISKQDFLEELVNTFDQSKAMIICENGPNGGRPMNAGAFFFNCRQLSKLENLYYTWMDHSEGLENTWPWE